MTDDRCEPDPLYIDIKRFMQMSDEHLEFALAAWCQYRAADGDLIEILVTHLGHLGEGRCRELKAPYFKKMVEKHPFVADYPHHVKAISLASCKYNQAFHPELVKSLLDSNSHITKEVIFDTLDRKLGDDRPPTTDDRELQALLMNRNL